MWEFSSKEYSRPISKGTKKYIKMEGEWENFIGEIKNAFLLRLLVLF